MNNKISNLKSENQRDRDRLLAEQAAMQANFNSNMKNIRDEMQRKDEEHDEKVKEMMKIIEKKNYESHYPIPEILQKHLNENENSFNIQILGCRGAGKSTFVAQ